MPVTSGELSIVGRWLAHCDLLLALKQDMHSEFHLVSPVQRCWLRRESFWFARHRAELDYESRKPRAHLTARTSSKGHPK